MTPLTFRILAVAYPELDGRLRASQQPQGASSGGGAVPLEQEGAASHMALEDETTDSEFTSETECEGSSTAGTGAETSAIDSSSDGSSLAVADTSVPIASTGTAATPPPAPPSLQPLSVYPVAAHPGGWASSSPQAPQPLPLSALLP
ncbi:hypothetical protein NDU88_006391 [Pleurodeles waltl]|uniref:Uncharacterized protein n=1 Tax=Pleurodeles waltl TaxID=8319 RepID=A0AAV7TE85_PLEWA|nr:hypothetical protein NDU88_006391 [Pleurodeles waltl]